MAQTCFDWQGCPRRTPGRWDTEPLVTVPASSPECRASSSGWIVEDGSNIDLLVIRGGSRETLNHSDDLVTSVALEATELGQLADTLNNDTVLGSRPCGYRPPPDHEEALSLFGRP